MSTFVTHENDPVTDRLVSAAEMRGIEARAMDAGSVTGAALMERAGQGAARAILRHMAGPSPARALVLCGPGNNGGDGYVVARCLAEAGWQVAVHAPGDPDRVPPDAAAAQARWRDRGPVGPLSDAALEPGTRLVVDALFGTGLTRPFTDAATARLIARAADSPDVLVAALDMPSGWCADSGRWLGAGPRTRADLTLAFHGPKRGHGLDAAPFACGALEIVGIGLASDEGVPLIGAPDPDAVLKGGGHKYDHGHALVLAGGVGQGGAARMAARAALRIGAGLVTLGVPGAALIENAARLDAVMLARVEDAEGLAARLDDPRLNAVLLGPGLGVGARTRALVAAALAAGRGTVLDADALRSFADAPEELLDALNARVVLTPHDGEFARLFPDLAEPLRRVPEAGPAPSRLDAARAAAERAGAVVLLKGPDTVIAWPGGAAVHLALYGRAAPWLATAGAGDVLAGMIAGLMARGLAAADAARAAVWLHAEAGRAFGPGLTAEDLPDQLPGVLARLGLPGA